MSRNEDPTRREEETLPEGGLDPLQDEFSPTERERRLEAIVSEFLLAREEGTGPRIEDWQARHPAFAEDLALLLSDESGGMSFMGPIGGAKTTDRLADTPLGGNPQKVGAYELLERVAVGGGGVVWRARHLEGRHVVALKVLDGFATADAREFKRFQREAAMLRSIDIVNVVPVVDVGEDAGRHYIAMKWIEGNTLSSLLEEIQAHRAEHALHSIKARVALMAKIARAFAAVHEHGILHRDVKPSNLLVDRTGEPMLIDFGIARNPDFEDLTMTGDGPLGTPRYLAPELLLEGNQSVTVRTDVYGLGLCLYELTSGTRAFVQCRKEDLYTQIKTEGPLPPDRVNPEVPTALAAAIMRATALRPDRRYASMTDFADDLERFVEGSRLDEETMRRVKPIPRFISEHPSLLRRSALLLGVGLCALLAWPWVKTQLRVWSQDPPPVVAQATIGELQPYLFAPREAYPMWQPEIAEANRELLAFHPTDVRHQLIGSWTAFLAGNLVGARSVLGEASSSDPASVALLRRYLDFILERPEDITREAVTSAKPMSQMPGESPPFDTFDIADLEALESSWSEAVGKRLERLRPPSPQLLKKFLQAQPAVDDADERYLRLCLQYHSVPDGLTKARTGEFAIPALIEALGAEAQAGRPWAGLQAASLSVRYGQPERAVRLLSALSGRRESECWQTAYLRALGLSLSVGSKPKEVLASFATASKLAQTALQARRDHCPKGLSVFEDQAFRKLHSSWAIYALDCEDAAAAMIPLSLWQEHLPPISAKQPYPATWPDRVIPALLSSRALALTNPELAIERLGKLGEADSELALIPFETAALIERHLPRQQEMADRLRERGMQSCDILRPRSVLDWTEAAWYGLRPYGRQVSFATVFAPAVPKD